MVDQIPDAVKSQRFSRLLEVQNEISTHINEKYAGQVVSVLCDGPSKENDKVYSGRTEGNKIVFFNGELSDIGQFINVKIERTEAFALYGQKN